MKRYLSILMAFVMLTMVLSSSADAASNVILEASRSVTVRAEPDKHSESLGTLQKGETIQCVGSKVNESGNVWYKVQLANGERGYVFSEKVQEHTHSFSKIAGANLSYCRCGAYQEASKGNTSVSVATGLLIPESTMTLVASAAEVGATVSAAIPYVGVVVVAGVVLYITLSVSSTAVDVSSVRMATNDSPEETEEDTYYYARLYNNLLLIDKSNELDIDDATELLKALTAGDKTLPVVNSDIHSIYTPTQKAAEALAENFTEENPFCNYGTSKEANHQSEVDHKPASYEHYHIYVNNRKKNIHIFFGAPRYDVTDRAA